MLDLFGIAGAGLILIGFVFVQKNIWQDEDLRYDLVNLVGGILLLISAYLIGSIPFFILNLVWTAVSARDVFITLSSYKPPHRKGKRGFSGRVR